VTERTDQDNPHGHPGTSADPDSPDPLDRLAALFNAVRDLPLGAREAAIDDACGDDAELAAEVRTLLVHHDAVAGPLAEPLSLHVDGSVALGASGVDRPSMPSVGPYRIVRPLGEGGMGVVHLAEQESPRRLVALKMLRPGLVGRSLMKRFAQESELLGRLQHPGIAAVYGAGTVDLGFGAQPYFAMEFVEGAPLTEHAERNALDRDARLRLIIEIAEALQHAHDRGIVHRDLKPANILVDAAGRPRILDFGVARSIDADAQLTTLRTDVGQLVGTIPYMSPEQLDGRPAVDARSDVYALGVLTYELLTGRLPHDLRERSVMDALASVRHEDPTTLAAVNSQFRGDLDVIVGKALERDPDRRYPSAIAFAHDLERALRHEPITARPPSVMYRSRKFVRRHRTLVASTALVMLVLAAATVVASLLAIEANSRRREASALSDRLAREVVVQRIRAIAADLDTSGGRAASRLLDALPESEQSRWEVRHLRAYLDGSTRRIAVDGQAILRSVVTTDGIFVAAERDGRILTVRGPVGALEDRDDDGMSPSAPTPTTTLIATLPSGLVDMVGTGELVIASADDGTVVALRARDGVERWRFDAGERVRLLADERAGTVILADERQRVRRLDLATGGEYGQVSVDSVVEPLALSPDPSSTGKSAYVWLRRGVACEIDLETGAILRELSGHPARVSAAVVAPDGSWLATGDAHGTVIVRDRASGALLRTLRVPHGSSFVHALAASPDGKLLVAGTGNGTVVAWDIDGTMAHARVVQLPETRVQALTWHADRPGTLVASAFPAGFFEVEVGTLDSAPSLPMLTRVATALDGHSAVIAMGNGSLLFVCLRTGVQIGSMRIGTSMVRAVDVGADGRTFVALDTTGALHRGTLGGQSGRQRHESVRLDSRVRSPAVALLADGRAAVSTSDGRVRLVDADGAVALSIEVDAERVGAITADLARVRFATGGAEGRLRLWSLEGVELASETTSRTASQSDSKNVTDMLDFDEGITAIAWIDDSTIAVGHNRGTLRVVDLGARDAGADDSRASSRLRTLWKVGAHPAVINAIAVAPDDSRIATASTDRTVRIFDLETGDEVLILREVTAAMQGIAFSADGATLMGTALDGTIRFWRTDPERVVAGRRRERAAALAAGYTGDDEVVNPYLTQSELANAE